MSIITDLGGSVHHDEDPVPEPMTNVDGLREFIDREVQAIRPPVLSSAQYMKLSEEDRASYDAARLAWFGALFQLRSDHAKLLVACVRGIIETSDPYTPGARGVVITGPAHIGKTTMLLRLAIELEDVARRINESFREDGHVPVVYVEVPPDATSKSVASSILTFFGVPHSDRSTQIVLLNQATAVLRARRTKVLLIDEVQMLKLDGKTGDSAMNTFKSIMNNSGAVCVFSGIDLTTQLASRSAEQIMERCEIIKVDPLTAANAGDRTKWGALVAAFESQMLLIGSSGQALQEHADLLFHASGGRIGTLRRILTAAHRRAVRTADADGRRSRVENISDALLAEISGREGRQARATPTTGHVAA